MSSITKDQAQDLFDSLATRHEPHHLCKPDTRLVLEGYPRSSNSFAVDILIASAGRLLHSSQLGHHTHDVANLQIADAYGIPKLILIREPKDAILSFHIYSRAPVAKCAKLYGDFYQGALELTDNADAAHFSEITGDFGKVVRKVNRLLGVKIPVNQDFEQIKEQALSSVRERAKSGDKDLDTRQVAAPNPEREVLKDKARSDVDTFLASHPRAERFYEKIMKQFKLTA